MKNPHTGLRIVIKPTLDGTWRLEQQVWIGTWPFRWQAWQLLPFKFASELEAQNTLNTIRYYLTGTF